MPSAEPRRPPTSWMPQGSPSTSPHRLASPEPASSVGMVPRCRKQATPEGRCATHTGSNSSTAATAPSKALKLDTNGTDTAEWTKSYQNAAGQAVETLYSDNAASTMSYAHGQLVRSVDREGVVTLCAYGALGQVEFRSEEHTSELQSLR